MIVLFSLCSVLSGYGDALTQVVTSSPFFSWVYKVSEFVFQGVSRVPTRSATLPIDSYWFLPTLGRFQRTFFFYGLGSGFGLPTVLNRGTPGIPRPHSPYYQTFRRRIKCQSIAADSKRETSDRRKFWFGNLISGPPSPTPYF